MQFGRYKVERTEIILAIILLACAIGLLCLFNPKTADRFDKPRAERICALNPSSGQDECIGPTVKP